MIIYKATNLINGKVYIGQTVNSLHTRKTVHISEATRKNRRKNFHFYSSIRKYGRDKIKWEVIDRAENIDELNDKEEYWIKYHNSTDKVVGYNKHSGGRNSIPTAETRKKMSISMKGKVFTPEHCRKISEGKKRRNLKWSKEHRKKIEDAKKRSGGWSSETSRRMSIARRRENLPIETRRKISKANTGIGNGRAVLTEDQVFEIKKLIVSGETGVSIARKFPVCRTAIMRIKHNKSWRHIAWP